jgi:hypothetical protein
MSTLEPGTGLSAWAVKDRQEIGSVSSTQTPERSSLSPSTQGARFEEFEDNGVEDSITHWLMSSMTKDQYNNRKKALWNCYHKKHAKFDDSCFTDLTVKSSLGSVLSDKWIGTNSLTTAPDSMMYKTYNLSSTSETAPPITMSQWFQFGYQDGRQYLETHQGFGNLGNSDYYKPKPEFSEIAIKRSERLLDRMLSSKQRKYWHRNRYIDIRSPAYPDRLYRIPEHGKILCFDSGKLTKRLCIYSIDRLPLADKLVALKVMIESDEQEFLRIAIPHPVKESGTQVIFGDVYTDTITIPFSNSKVTIINIGDADEENIPEPNQAVA